MCLLRSLRAYPSSSLVVTNALVAVEHLARHPRVRVPLLTTHTCVPELVCVLRAHNEPGALERVRAACAAVLTLTSEGEETRAILAAVSSPQVRSGALLCVWPVSVRVCMCV